MESSALLVMGVGGLGCRWARGAHSRIPNESDLMLVDADAESFRGVSNAHCLHLDATGSERGIAALPSLAAHRAAETLDEIRPVLGDAELVVILAGLGGGTGTGATIELARAAKRNGAIVAVVAGLPFAEQTFLGRMAEDALPSI